MTALAPTWLRYSITPRPDLVTKFPGEDGTCSPFFFFTVFFNFQPGSNFIVFWKVGRFPQSTWKLKVFELQAFFKQGSFSALGSYSKTGLQDYPTLSQFHLLVVLYLHWCLWRFYLSFILFLSQLEFPFLLTIILTRSISSSLTSSSLSNINMFWNLTLLLQQYQVPFYGSKKFLLW